MPENVAVTVSGVHGTSHYKLTRRSVTRIKFLILLFLVALVSVAATVFTLVEDVRFTRAQQSLLEQSYLEQNEELSQYQSIQQEMEEDILLREEALNTLTSRLGEIETQLGENNDGLDMETRLDIAAINTAVRLAILRQIPNGAPVKGRTSSPFGMRTHPVTKKKTLHKGLDFAVNTGTEIYAPADGVIQVTRKSRQGSGNFIRIVHSFGITSSYSHLKSFKVKPGQFVQKGDLIGISGNTGLTSGPHLHYEIRFVGKPLDPKHFVKWDINNFDTVFNNQKGVPWDYLVKRVEQQVSLALQLSSPQEPSSQAKSPSTAISMLTEK